MTNYMSLFSKTVQLLSTNSILHIPLNTGFSPFLTLGYCSSPHNLISDSEDASSYRLINLKSYRCLKLVQLGCPLFQTVSWSCKANTV